MPTQKFNAAVRTAKHFLLPLLMYCCGTAKADIIANPANWTIDFSQTFQPSQGNSDIVITQQISFAAGHFSVGLNVSALACAISPTVGCLSEAGATVSIDGAEIVSFGETEDNTPYGLFAAGSTSNGGLFSIPASHIVKVEFSSLYLGNGPLPVPVTEHATLYGQFSLTPEPATFWTLGGALVLFAAYGFKRKSIGRRIARKQPSRFNEV